MDGITSMILGLRARFEWRRSPGDALSPATGDRVVSSTTAGDLRGGSGAAASAAAAAAAAAFRAPLPFLAAPSAVIPHTMPHQRSSCLWGPSLTTAAGGSTGVKLCRRPAV